MRLLGFAALVGIVAGLGGIAFYMATRVVEHYALGVWAGYYPQPHPGGESSFPWLTVVKHPFHPWLLLLIPTLGGIVSGLLVLHRLWPWAVPPPASFVVDAQSRLLDVVNLEEAHVASVEPALKSLVCAEDLMRTDIRPLTPNDTLDRALELFVENDLLALPIVNDLKQRVVIGMVQRHEIAGAYLRCVHGPAKMEDS